LGGFGGGENAPKSPKSGKSEKNGIFFFGVFSMIFGRFWTPIFGPFSDPVPTIIPFGGEGIDI
jgi:hypothetical protein